jgi:glycosyltransferase involved in cell wall biosynthesis
MDQPLVSIIIPTYNRAELLGDTLTCVIDQTYNNWECIIVDDNSTDETVKVIHSFQEKDNRFKLIIKPKTHKQGASISKNLGLKIAAGDYIQFLDSDDILKENKLHEQINLLLKESKHTIAICKWGSFKTLDQGISIYEDKDDYRSFDNSKEYFDLIGLHGGFYPCHNFLISKELINFSGYWNESLTVNDDGEFFFRILLNAEKILFTDKTYVLYRSNSTDNLSVLNSESKATSLLNSWKIIEVLFITKYNERNSLYINKKKSSVYNEFKRIYPKIISQNKDFFKQQIKEDTLVKKIKKLKKRIKNRLKIIFRF